MYVLTTVAGLVLIFSVLLDAFETIVLPRRVQRHFRLTAWFYRRTWRPWRALARHIKTSSRRENFLGYFGPLSLIFLLALWAFCLILGFAFLQYGFGKHVQLGSEKINLWTILYLSGETFFTLGLGEVLPTAVPGRVLTVLE
ncbi:MAG: ion channel, partial [Terriglobales bacterium]